MSSLKNKNSELIVATVVERLIRHLRVKVTETTIQESLLSQPDYPSLSSIINVLSKWNIQSLAVQAELSQLETDVTYPCIAHLNENEGVFVVLESTTNNSIKYFHPVKGTITSTLQEFEKIWSGVVLMVETNENSGELDYENKRREERWNRQKKPLMNGLTVLSLIAVLSFSFIFKNNFLPHYILNVFSLVGFGISLMLVHTKYSAVKSAFCPVNEKIDCNQVINSNGAKIISWLDLTDLCVIFFGGSFISFLVSSLSNNNHVFVLLSVLNLLSLPFCVFSLIYQKFVLKKWCLLCLGVVGVLLVNSAFSTYFEFWKGISEINFVSLFLFLFSFVSSTLIWFLFRSLLPYLSKFKKTEARLQSILKNKAVFNALIENLNTVEIKPSDNWIELGNPGANLKVLVFLSPTCPACARTFPLIARLAANEEVSVKILLCPYNNNAIYTFVERIISYNNKRGKDETLLALNQWFNLYSTGKGENWFKQFVKIEADEEKYEALIHINNEIMSENKVTHIPTFIIDDKIIPSDFDVEIIESIIENRLSID